MPNQEPKEDTAVYRAIVFGLILFALVFIGLTTAYFLNFGSVSPDQEHWGQFGDYLGGTLNPLLGYASVVLLALTLRAQHRVLQESRRQAVLQELQRMLSSIGEQLDAALHRPVNTDGNMFEFWTQSRGLTPLPDGPVPTPTFHDILERACERLRSEKLDYFALDAVARAWELGAVHAGLVRLDECLREFLAKGGDPVLAKLYGSQYRVPATFLSALHTLAHFPPDVREYPDDAIERLGLAEATKDLHRGMGRISAQLERLISDSLEAAHELQDEILQAQESRDAGPTAD